MRNRRLTFLIIAGLALASCAPAGPAPDNPAPPSESSGIVDLPFQASHDVQFSCHGTTGLYVADGGYSGGPAVVPNAPQCVVHSQVLVGTGCTGPSDIAVATEEDMLSGCDRIEVHQVDRSY